jgi:glycosyltransferase involved in cell wall biosynthesis
MNEKGHLPVVHILMATCEGERYLGEQLASIQAQTYPHWVLHVSDDGSTDKTLDVIHSFETSLGSLDGLHERHGLIGSRVFYYKGPRQGSTQNFLHLVRSVMERYELEESRAEQGSAEHGVIGDSHGEAKRQHDGTVGINQSIFNPEDLFAFADQDDVWLPEKLERAVAWHTSPRTSLDSLGRDEPVKTNSERQMTGPHPMLYAAQTIKVDARLRPLGSSNRPKGTLCFNAALVENTLSGNTMVMNVALMTILRKIDLDHSVWHDWSTYQVASACCGEMKFDEKPCLLYRQHEGNVIGVKTGLFNQSLRMGKVLQGRYKTWTQTNLLGLKDIEHQMSWEAQELVRLYSEIRECKSFWRRLFLIRGLDIRRQNMIFQVLLYLGLLLSWF